MLGIYLAWFRWTQIPVEPVLLAINYLNWQRSWMSIYSKRLFERVLEANKFFWSFMDWKSSVIAKNVCITASSIQLIFYWAYVWKLAISWWSGTKLLLSWQRTILSNVESSWFCCLSSWSWTGESTIIVSYKHVPTTAINLVLFFVTTPIVRLICSNGQIGLSQHKLK